MKRVLSALLALATFGVAHPVQAKVAVTWGQVSVGAYPYSYTYAWDIVLMRRVLDKLGGDYILVPPQQAKTEFCRTGDFVHGYGTDGACVTHVDGVIHLEFGGGANGSGVTGYNPDSLTLTRTLAGTAAAHGMSLPAVPQLFFLNQAGNGALLADKAADTLGAKTLIAAGGGVGNHEGEGTCWPVGQSERWFDLDFSVKALLNAAAPPAGGLRPILGLTANAYFAFTEGGQAIVTASPDSCGAFVFPDTVLVWDRLNAHVTGAAPIVCAFGPAPALQDSAGQASGNNSMFANPTMDFGSALVALAHFDSLTGHKLFPASTRKVVRYAIGIDGAGVRSDRGKNPGIAPGDTAATKAAGDSVATLGGIPITVAADPESLALRPSDLSMWRRFGSGVQFTPFVWTGVSDTTLADLKATPTRPVDPFGHYRSRNIFGPGTGAADDTSLYAQGKAARDNLLALVGAAHMSRAAIVPNDDWSPRNIYYRTSGMISADSVLCALDSLGYRVLAVNSRDDAASVDLNRVGNPLGWWREQGRRQLIARPGKSMYLAGHEGVFPFSGAISNNIGNIEPSTPVQRAAQFWGGVLCAPLYPYNFYQYDTVEGQQQAGGFIATGSQSIEDAIHPSRTANVLLLRASNFGTQDTGGPWTPTPGWLIIKHVTHLTRAVNRLNGQAMLECVPLDRLGD